MVRTRNNRRFDENLPTHGDFAVQSFFMPFPTMIECHSHLNLQRYTQTHTRTRVHNFIVCIQQSFVWQLFIAIFIQTVLSLFIDFLLILREFFRVFVLLSLFLFIITAFELLSSKRERNCSNGYQLLVCLVESNEIILKIQCLFSFRH